MQKIKNQNKFVILLLVITLFSIAIISSLDTISAAYVDSSFNNTEYRWEQESRWNYSNSGIYEYQYRYVGYTVASNGDANRPYTDIQTAYNNAGLNELIKISGNVYTGTLNVNNNSKGVEFSYYLPSSSTNTLPSFVLGASGWSSSSAYVAPSNGMLSYIIGSTGTTTTLGIVSVSSTNTNNFTGTGGSTSNLVINSLTTSAGTQNLKAIKINAMTTTGGHQYFTNNVYATGIVNFNGGTPHFDGPVVFDVTTVNIANNSPGFVFNANVTFNGNTNISNNASDYSHNFTDVKITGSSPSVFKYSGHSATRFLRVTSTIPVEYYANKGTFDYCNFTNGFTILGGPHGDFRFGGCIFNKTNGIAFDNSIINNLYFYNCTFRNSDIGIFNPTDDGHTPIDPIECVVTLDNCNLYDNIHAIVNYGNLNIINGTKIYRNNGTAIVLLNNASSGNKQRTTISGSYIENNTKNTTGTYANLNNGAGIYIVDGILNISSTRFYNNIVTGNGGAIYQIGGIINLNPTPIGNQTNPHDYAFPVFENNKANNGGAIYTNATVNGYAKFNDNEATIYGGAIYLIGDGLTLNTLPVYNQTNSSQQLSNFYPEFNRNHAEYGGAIYHLGNVLNLHDYRFNSNTASKDGGAVYSNGTRISGGVFYDNRALDGYGGALYSNVTSNVTISGGTYSRNNASIEGGAVYARASNVTISGGTYSNNNATNNGGAIYQNSTGSLRVTGSSFSGNRAINGDGGAILANAITVDIISSTFSGNLATSTNGDGGAICHNGTGNLTVSSSTFDNNQANSANGRGGAIYSNSTYVTINSNSRFGTTTGNTASIGGAIYLNADSGELHVDYSRFDNNSATNGDGGAIYQKASTGYLGLDHTTFTNNRATHQDTNGGAISSNINWANIWDSNFDRNVAQGYGGAIYLNNTENKLNVGYSNFTSNDAMIGDGGAICQLANTAASYLDIEGGRFTSNFANTNGGAIWSAVINSTVNGVSFYNNAATYSGGAIYLSNMDGFLDLINSYFDGNRAWHGSGGAVYQNSSGINGYLNITSGGFRNNHANETNGLGGAVYTNAHEVIVKNVITGFVDNTASNGGAIFSNNSAGNLTVIGSNFDRNTATFNGGAVFSNSQRDTYYRSNIRDGAANLGGGIYYNGTVLLNITESNITNNKAINGGGIYTVTAPDIIINGSVIGGNNATINGGGIFYGNETGNLNITNSNFRNNNATGNGGGVWTNASNVIVNANSFFDGNYAGNNGGGIYYTDDSGTSAYLNITDSTFLNNIAHADGGGIWTNTSDVTVDSSLFNGNNATTGNGGGIYYTEDGKFNVTNTTFNYNYAGTNGGAILTNTSTFYITDSVFNYNTAGVDGGAIHYKNVDGNFNVTNLTFNGNTAIRNGGGVWTDVKEFNVTDSRFNGNSAILGGGLYYIGEKLNTTNTNFTNNRASSSGGAIWTDCGQVDINTTNFIGNIAGLYGGAIYQLNNTGYLNITSSYLAYNYAAVDGGAINTNAYLTKIHNTTLLGNIAGHYGGAYYNVDSASSLEVTSSVLNNNRASQGGAIYTSGKSTWIYGSTLNGNYAYNSGGAVFQTGSGYLTISQSVLDNNAAFYSGGAVYTSVGTTIEDSSLSNNLAELFYGGAVCNEGPELRVFRSNFINNAAMLLGAAIYNYQYGRTVVVDSRFLNNHGVITSNRHDYALVDVGDAVGAIGNRGQLEVTDAYFSGNALAIADHGHMFVTQSLFENNIWAILMAGVGSQVFSNTFLNNNLAFNVTGKDNVLIYNRVVVPFMGKGLMNSGINTFANLNWWGKNDINDIVQGIILDNWFIMYLTNDEKLNFINPGDGLSYTYHFELNTKEPCNLDYLPYFTVTVSHNGINETFQATQTRSWYVPFSTTDFYFVSATLDNQFATFNVNNYSTKIKIDDYDAKLGETVILTATLTDAYGTPLINRKVEFWIDNIIVGTAYTDLDGIARFEHKANKEGTNYLSARFTGDNYPVSYYIRGLTGSGFYKPSSMSPSILYVTTGTANLIGRFTSGNTTANNVNTSVVEGSKFTFRYTLTNLDAAEADLVVTFKIPTGLKFVNAVVGGLKFNVPENRWVYDKKTNTLTFYIKLGNRTSFKNSISIDLTLTAAKVGKYTIIPTITSNNTKIKANAGSLTINVKAKSATNNKLSDLIITKVKKVNGAYKITVKNNGTATAKESFLQLICGCKKYSKLANVKTLAAGESTTLTVIFSNKGMNHVKYANINYNKKVVESNYKNNIYKLGKM